MQLPTPDALEKTLTIVQIAFYVIGAILGILTYRAAKRGLLNTVNTEYQKRVMDRLPQLSADLYSEVDPSSPTHWSTANPVRDAIGHINEVFQNNKTDILNKGKFYYGIPV